MSDDDNDICPLCCEELDLSDQSFYPCKCGYQVCMWCWHRIKESESGLCPACRTPYGDDPHEFSAVDMEDVVKANKEKALAEKRERERLRAMREQEKREQLAHYTTGGSYGHGIGGSSGGTTNFAGALVSGGLGTSTISSQFDGADLVAALGSAHHSSLSSASHHHHANSRGPPEPPKDRSTLATMRVIRRNLVYAVGMPPNIATEENLRKPEYFGQYGKISKIVINRNQNPGDPRRASASAYVTFAHKEDTLACILALDGFYHDGRNIRASYGTSKYCSAFIKNVRCNNPDCTYLHHMGDTEDTFTKQEIQAGYVTSGRDVLARQQQIMAQQAAAVFGPGVGGGNSRRKVGGGGPSGTGRQSSGPVFPPPTFDEPLPKSKRGFIGSGVLQQSAMQRGGPSAASIVAGKFGNALAAPPAPHATLTPLTSLKRVGSMTIPDKLAGIEFVASGTSDASSKAMSHPPLVGSSSDLTPAESHALQEQCRTAALAQQQQQQREMMATKQHNRTLTCSGSTSSSPSHSSVGSSRSAGSHGAGGWTERAKCDVAGASLQQQNIRSSANSAKQLQQPQTNSARHATPGLIGSGGLNSPVVGSIAGSNINNSNRLGSPLLGSSFTGILARRPVSDSPASPANAATLSLNHHTGSGILGGKPLAVSSENGIIGGASLETSPGNMFGGLGLLSDSSSGGMDKWGAAGGSNQIFNGSGALFGDSNCSAHRRHSPPAPIGSHRTSTSAALGDVGGMSLFGTSQNNAYGGCGSSALASMLGIQLPTGSGTLREVAASPYTGESMAPADATEPSSVDLGKNNVGAIGKPNRVLQPIGAPMSSQGSVPIGCYRNNNHDVALLQSLLPGVNITSGNSYCPPEPQYHKHPRHSQQIQQQQPVGVTKVQWNEGANNVGSVQQQPQQEQHHSTIW